MKKSKDLFIREICLAGYEKREESACPLVYITSDSWTRPHICGVFFLHCINNQEVNTMDFRTQIDEDIKYYQENHPHVEHIKKDEWAFNFWILDKLFSEDEDEIENKIIDYADNGIDCYVWHEETHDLYLIQNKYYGDQTPFTKSYFTNAVQDGYTQLLEGTYQRSPELQDIFTKNHSYPDFYVYHYFYVTNNRTSSDVNAAVEHFNEKNSNKQRYAQVFYLDDIEEAFYGKPKTPEKHIEVQLETVNKGTRLAVNNESYGLDLPFDAKYFMLSVITLYKALVYAEDMSYPIFDANIREYLGTAKAVNKEMINTLRDPDERKNFFFYNNGITIICANAEEKTEKDHLAIKLKDPQIVNGCQTVSSIKRVLDSHAEPLIEKDFADVYVMAKILEIPDENEEQQELRKKIVRYNNSQNSIDEKTFEANSEMFRRLQVEFEKHGFLLLLKQSDSQKYSERYKKPTELRERAERLINRFGLTDKLTKTKDFNIPLDKLMQVVLAFFGDARQAFQKKGQLLKKGSSQYNLVTEKIKSPELTTMRLLDLYLLYLRSEKAKAANQTNGKVPITWYFIEGFSRFECEGANCARIDDYLDDSEKIASLVRLYTGATKLYLGDYESNNPGKGYNDMIKEELDLELLKRCRETAMLMLE